MDRSVKYGLVMTLTGIENNHLAWTRSRTSRRSHIGRV